MPMVTKFCIFQFLIIAPFIFGYLIKRRMGDPDNTAQKIIKGNLIFIEPLIILWSVWGLQLKSEFILLPLLGLALVISGFALGYMFLSALRLKGVSRPTFCISSSLANHGFTMGGFLCYLFLGEPGLGLSYLFIFYFTPYVFIFIFSYAQIAGDKKKYTFRDVPQFIFSIRNMPLYAAVVAFVFHAVGAGRPDIFFPLDFMLMTSVALYYFSLGMTFNIKSVRGAWREIFVFSGIKFLAIPLIAIVLCEISGIGGSMRTVVLIESFMPAAIYSVITAILFKLDSELASGLFVANTLLFLALVMPLLFVFRAYL